MNNIYDRCPNCMNPYPGDGQPCQYCGQDVMGYVAPKNCLPPFTILQNKYMVGRVLGQGGFGITYIGYDMNLATYVAIKEYYPESISTRGLADNVLMVTAQAGKDEIYNKNLNRFVDEARNLSKFYGLPGIVSVRNFFYENGTAYIVMDYVAGENLKKYLADNGGKLDENTVLALMKPVLESLYEIHKKGLIHRDISPDNIMFDDDGRIKLIDFGAVRGSSAETEMTYTVMLKHGYAPQEQYYTKGNQGPWTDIYSLCATMYKMLTGMVPPNCIERMSEDSYMPPSQCGVEVSPGVEAALNKGLAVNIADRYQDIGALIKDLYGKEYTFMGDGQIGVTEVVNALPEASSSKGLNKKMIAIIASSLAAFVLLVVCLKVFVLGGDEGKGTTEASIQATVETPTDATTTEATTTETTTTEAVPEYNLEGAWSDYKFMIDDTNYTLPMTYSEWTAQGWSPMHEVVLTSGELKGVKFTSDKLEMTALMVNYTGETATLDKCHVVGIQYIFDEYEVYNGKELTLPSNVKVNLENCAISSDYDYVYETYGEATYGNKGEWVSYLQYMDDNQSNVYLRFDENKVLYYMWYRCFAAPEGAVVQPSSTTETVALCQEYQVPGATTDRYDDIINIQGYNYKLRCPVSEFINNGWTLNVETEEMKLGSALDATLTKGDATLTVLLENPTVYNIRSEQSIVTSVEATEELASTLDITFPGGVKLGMNDAVIDKLFADVDGFESVAALDIGDFGDASFSFENGVPDGGIIINLKFVKNEDGSYRLVKYAYERNRSTLEMDPENTDYITGAMADENAVHETEGTGDENGADATEAIDVENIESTENIN